MFLGLPHMEIINSICASFTSNFVKCSMETLHQALKQRIGNVCGVKLRRFLPFLIDFISVSRKLKELTQFQFTICLLAVPFSTFLFRFHAVASLGDRIRLEDRFKTDL
jgi:hypothetical protein